MPKRVKCKFSLLDHGLANYKLPFGTVVVEVGTCVAVNTMTPLGMASLRIEEGDAAFVAKWTAGEACGGGALSSHDMTAGAMHEFQLKGKEVFVLYEAVEETEEAPTERSAPLFPKAKFVVVPKAEKLKAIGIPSAILALVGVYAAMRTA